MKVKITKRVMGNMKKRLFLSSLLGCSVAFSMFSTVNAAEKEKVADVTKKAITLDEAEKQKSKLWFQGVNKNDIYRMAVKLVRDGVFLDDFEQAVLKSRKENKPLLVEFVGSNWCPACMMLIKNVFVKKEFQNYAKENLVLMLVDIPRDVKQNKELFQQNMALIEIFKVSGYPTGVMLNPHKLNQKLYGYVGGVESAATYLDSMSDGVDSFYNVLWERGLDIAKQNAKNTKKKILVEFVKDESIKGTKVAIKENKPTAEFAKNLFEKNKFKQYVQKNLILLRLNLKDDAELAKKYQVTKPTLMILDETGKVVKTFAKEDVKNIDNFLKKINKK